jgi:hypothetical protein
MKLLHKIEWNIKQALYWLRTHTYNRYHLLDIRNKRNGYAWGWLDRSEAILFANMALLVQFVEKESGLNCHVDWRSAEEAKTDNRDVDSWEKENGDAHANAAKEMREIYAWWTKGRKEEHDALEELEDRAFDYKTSFNKRADGLFSMETNQTPEQEVEDSLSKKDEEMVIRLIKVSGYMWT